MMGSWNWVTFCFGDICRWGLTGFTWPTESIFCCLLLKSSGKFGNGEVVRSRGSTTSLRRVFFFSGSDDDGGVGDFVFPAGDVYGRLLCFSWYLARFGYKEHYLFHHKSLCLISLCSRHNPTPVSYVWASDRLNKLLETCFQFLFKLIGKSTMAF